MKKVTWWDIVSSIVVGLSTMAFFEFLNQCSGYNTWNILFALMFSFILGIFLYYVESLGSKLFKKRA